MITFRKYINVTQDITIIMHNVTMLSDKTLILSGMHIVVDCCDLSLTHLIVENVPSPRNMLENPKITIHNSSFGSLDLQPGTEAVINDCYFENILNSTRTLDLITTKSSRLIVQDSVFVNFLTENNWTIIDGYLGSTVFIQSSKFQRNHGYWGVIVLHDNCSLQLNNTEFLGNSAYRNEFSPITLSTATLATVINSTFMNNSASFGGMFKVDGQSHLNCYRCEFSGNAAIQGGAIFVNGSSFVGLFSSSLEKNKAEKVDLLQLMDANKELTRISGYQNLLHNKISQGGAIYGRNSTVNIYDSTLANNSALQGGAISLHKDSISKIRDAKFLSNLAMENDGGAINFAGSFYLQVNSSQFRKNKAKRYGGGINFTISERIELYYVTFHENEGKEGGAISLKSAGPSDIQHCNFTFNSAKSRAGALLLENSALNQILNCLFSNNEAPDTGAVRLGYTDRVIIHGTLFLENKATGTYGGSIVVHLHVKLNIQRCTFRGNQAVYYGGAIAGQIYITVTVRESIFENNKATSAGAIALGQNSTMRVERSNFTGNSALLHGGAIASSGPFNISIFSCSFTDNKAVDTGGALGFRDSGHLNVNRVELMNNVAENDGGAIGAEGPSVYITIRNTLCVGNKAYYGGGCLYYYRDVDINVYNTKLSENMARTGGAIHILASGRLQVNVYTFFV